MTTRHEILLLLRKHPGATVSELAARTGLTNMGVRRHLDALAADGLAESTAAATGAVGRPPAAWRLTAAGLETFPRRYDVLVLEVLEDVAEEAGPDVLEAILGRRTEKLAVQYRDELDGCQGLRERVARLAALRDADGYLAEVIEDDGDLLLVENNCAVHRVARRFPAMCAMELALFRRCLGESAEVTRESHTLSGDAVCCYRITPRGDDASS